MREERKERGEEGRGEGRKERGRKEGEGEGGKGREGRRERNKGEHHIAMLQEWPADIPYLQLDSLAL